MPHVTLTPDPNIKGRGAGHLQDHPCKVRVSTQRLHGDLVVELFDGPHRIGEGLLHERDGQWRGTCSEFAGRWEVSWVVNSGLLVFE